MAMTTAKEPSPASWSSTWLWSRGRGGGGVRCGRGRTHWRRGGCGSVVVVGAVVGGTVVVVVGATVVVVTGTGVVVVSWAAAGPARTPSSIGAPAIARSSAVVRPETF